MNVGTIVSQALNYIAEFAETARQFLEGLQTPDLQVNWIVVLFVVFAILLIGFSLGRSRMLMVLLSVYAAFFIENRFIYFGQVRNYFDSRPDFIIHIGLFAFLFLLIFYILDHSVLKHRLTMGESSLFSVFLLSLATVGFLASIVLSYLPPEQRTFLPPQLAGYFTTKTAQFFWAIVPIAAAVFLKSNKRKGTAED